MQQYGFCRMFTALVLLPDHRRYCYMFVELISFILIHNSTLQEKKAEEKHGIYTDRTQPERNTCHLSFPGKLPQSKLTNHKATL